ncbi:MAG: hypothetical protein C0598_05885 [Marinilabiliales bacterium]|nr:MAG: hypothetical protein C0598_05885 [Marinilabiliales bacterium]
MNLKRLSIFIIFLISAYDLIAQSDAGIIPSSISNAVITASSGSNIEFIRDGNEETFWESSNALPERYIQSEELNIFLQEENYKLEGESNKYLLAFDGNINSKAVVKKGKTIIKLYENNFLKFFSLKLNTQSEVEFEIVFRNGKIINKKYAAQDSYVLQGIEINENSLVKEIHFSCKESFELFELAAIGGELIDRINFEFPSPIEIGVIISRHLNYEGVDSIQLLYSNNKTNWSKISNLNPKAVASVSLLINPIIYARYLQIVIFSSPKPYKKVSFREFAVYDRYGIFGKPADALASKRTWKESFGVNTIWGWGFGVSSKQIGNNAGAAKFSKITSLARSYHRIDWDLQKPGDTPEFILREKAIDSINNKWLNWKEEYAIWQDHGIETDACILFNNDYFPESKWTNAFYQAKKYGEDFSSFFEKNKLIRLIEIGNEPWGYSKSLYSEILKGMAVGIKNTSTTYKVIPCAMQAYNKHLYLNNYISDYILPNNKIDGLNTHIYSYIINEDGDRVAVNPEDPRSETWSVNNLKKWAAANNFSDEIYVSEYGFDSEGGDDCIHSNCVSEYEQAIYGLRQSLIFYRLGVKEFYWYFFANVDWESILHNRSGLLSNYSSGFQEKLSFKVFETIYSILKDSYFTSVILENNEVYCYSYKNKLRDENILIAWRPTSSNHKEKKWVSIPINANIKSVIDVTNPSKEVSYKKEINKLKIALNGSPVVITLR